MKVVDQGNKSWQNTITRRIRSISNALFNPLSKQIRGILCIVVLILLRETLSGMKIRLRRKLRKRNKGSIMILGNVLLLLKSTRRTKGLTRILLEVSFIRIGHRDS